MELHITQEFWQEMRETVREIIREEAAAIHRVPEQIHGTTAAHAFILEHFPAFPASRATFGNQVSAGKVPVLYQKEHGQYVFSGPGLLTWVRAGRPTPGSSEKMTANDDE